MPKAKSPHARTAPTVITTTTRSKYRIYDLPTYCPRCRRNSIPLVLGNAAISVYDDGPTEITVGVPLSCPSCNGAYIAEYLGAEYSMMNEDDDSLEFVGTVPAAEPQVVVSDALTKISPLFAQVYDEAVTAENTGLEELSGAGYRRALAFLVKDYLISVHREKRDDYVR